MANSQIDFRFLRGLKENLPSGTSIVDGTLYFCTDTLDIYEGYKKTVGNETVHGLRRYGGVSTVACTNAQSPNYVDGDSVLPDTANSGVLYYCVKDNILAAFDVDESQWIQINMTYSAYGEDKAGLVPGYTEDDNGKFLGLGGWTAITGADVILSGYTLAESSGSSITEDDTVAQAIGKLEKTLKQMTEVGGEPNQNAFSKITITGKSSSDTVIEGDSEVKNLNAANTTDEVKLAAADKWTAITVDDDGKTIKVGHAGAAENTGAFGPSVSDADGTVTIPSFEVDKAGHVVKAANKTVTLPTQTDYSIKIVKNDSSEYASSYTFKQLGEDIETINIPKDMVVSAGAVVDVADNQIKVNDDPETYLAAGKYIQLTLANATSDKIYIPVKELVDVYTSAQNAAEVQVSISASNEISAVIVDGSVGTAKLTDNSVTNAKLAKAAAYTVKANNTNAEANSTDVLVKDLVLAGFTLKSGETQLIAEDKTIAEVFEIITSAFIESFQNFGFELSRKINKEEYTGEGSILVGVANDGTPNGGGAKALSKGSEGQVLKVVDGKVTWAEDNNDDTHHEAKLVVANTADGKENTEVTGNELYFNLVENNEVRSSHKVTTSSAISATADAEGNIHLGLVWGTF